MTKRFVFLLVLLLVLLTSTVTVLAFDTNPPPAAAKVAYTEVKVPDITSPGGVTYYTNKNASLFFNQDNQSKENFLVCVSANRDLKTNDLLRYTLSGSIKTDENAADATEDSNDPLIVLLYIKIDGAYEPLNTIDAKTYKDTNMLETNRLIYAKVLLQNLGNEKVNQLRMIAFRKSQLNQLELDKNLQITDLKVVARTYAVMDRARIGIYDIMNIFQLSK